ncbi:MAG: hypothetical protein GC129_02110 [Proteobacteria bacterium]|nr:hypothetical protein [Pseudomonadota bacterium]
MNKLTATIFTLALTACASSGVYVDQSQLADFKKGHTTRAEVLQKLGQPSQRIVDTNGNTSLIYSYFESTARPETFIPIVGGLVGGADTRTNIVTLTFGPNDVLRDYSLAGSQTGTGMNLSSGVTSQRVQTTPRQANQNTVGTINE